MMDKQKNLQKVLLPILAVCFAAALAVMIFALNRPQEKAEFTPPPFESAAEQGAPESHLQRRKAFLHADFGKRADERPQDGGGEHIQIARHLL